MFCFDNEMVILWSTFQAPPYASWNGDPLGYQIWYGIRELVEQDEIYYEQVTVNYRFSQVLLSDLQQNTSYVIKMRAYNFLGNGPFSDTMDTFTQKMGEAILSIFYD